jgi:hypothetical protein
MNLIALTEIDEERTIHVRADSIVDIVECEGDKLYPSHTELSLTRGVCPRVLETAEEVLLLINGVTVNQ